MGAYSPREALSRTHSPRCGRARSQGQSVIFREVGEIQGYCKVPKSSFSRKIVNYGSIYFGLENSQT